MPPLNTINGSLEIRNRQKSEEEANGTAS